MFFLERMKSISPNDLVLKVGPGEIPHPTRGKAETTYYEGGTFPFKDNEFDYIIYSHILEHIPQNDLHESISELTRVALRGYLEFPNVFYELINYQDVHLWMMN